MNGAADAKKALRALGSNADAIVESFINRGFGSSDEDRKAIDAMSKYRLVTHLDDDDTIRVRNVVARLLNHTMGRAKQESADAQISAMWKDLNDKFGHYREALKLNSFDDVLNLESEIQEQLAEIIEDINNATSQFSYFISTGFSHVAHLDLRLRINEQAINQGRRLNDVLESFSIEELSELARGNEFLARMLLKILPRQLEIATKNLASALKTLAERLVKLRKDASLTNMIISFEKHLLRDPNFRPSIAGLTDSKLPASINVSSPITLFGYADVETVSEHQISLLAEIINKVPAKDDAKKPESVRTGEIQIDLYSAPQEIESDPVDTALSEMVTYIIDEGETVKASQIITALELDITVNDLMVLAAGYIRGLPASKRAAIDYRFIGGAHPHYKDVLIATDMEITSC